MQVILWEIEAAENRQAGLTHYTISNEAEAHELRPITADGFASIQPMKIRLECEQSAS